MKRLLAAALAVAASALIGLPARAADMAGPVGDVTVYRGTPTVDGVIDADEYQGAKKVIVNHTNMKALPDAFANNDVPESLEIATYQLWDDEGLYFAVEVRDEHPVRGQVTDGSWALNGDNLQLFIDPGPTLAGRELLDTEKHQGRRSPLYTFGMNEDDTYFWLRQLVKNEGILNLSEDPPPSAMKATDSGWVLEFRLPWSMLATDINEKVEGGGLSMDFFEDGTEIALMFIYVDYEKQNGQNTPVGMYETSLQTAVTPFDWQPEIFGMFLLLSKTDHRDAPEEPPETTAAATEAAASTAARTAARITAGATTAADGEAKENNRLVIGLGITAAVVVAAGAAAAMILMKRKKHRDKN